MFQIQVAKKEKRKKKKTIVLNKIPKSIYLFYIFIFFSKHYDNHFKQNNNKKFILSYELILLKACKAFIKYMCGCIIRVTIYNSK